MKAENSKIISEGRSCLGLELGSTRIKAVLIDGSGAVLATGGHDWENRFDNGIWTYAIEDIIGGLQGCYKSLAEDVRSRYGVTLERVSAIGISGMMHGYLPLDRDGRLLTPFRTWRNTTTAEAAEKLTELFSFNIPQRWSIAHIYQAMLNGEAHVENLDFVTTLAGYIHFLLTGERVVGIGEASGMFPVSAGNYDAAMTEKFDAIAAQSGYSWRLRNILPRVLRAGESAGALTAEGARLLDPSGALKPGIPLAPPEGDAGTGMVATNAVAPRTGNVSAGTSVFLMAVLEKPLAEVHTEIDMVTTPDGAPVAMVHCNTCTSELNAWAGLFREALELMGHKADMNELFTNLFRKGLKGENDCGGLLAYNYHAGEPITGFERGVPLLVRPPESRLSLSNFMRAQLYSSVATLRLGMDILEGEDVRLERLLGHGGFFKTEAVGQRVMAAALNIPVSVMETAGEGGPWGMALLASYMVNREEGESLEGYLAEKIFDGARGETIGPDTAMREGFESFLERYKRGLAIERAAVDAHNNINE